ncbi:MAG: DMT family transporter, partial [Metallosphaera sp.]
TIKNNLSESRKRDFMRSLGYAYITVLIIVWSLNFPVSKIALNFMSPFVLTIFRLLFAGIVLTVLGRGLVVSMKALINGLLNVALFVILLNTSLYFTTNPALTSVLIYTQPIFLVIMSPLINERVEFIQTIGVIVSFLGILISVNFLQFDLGSILAIGASLSWALGTVYYKKNLDKNIDNVKLNAFMSLTSLIIVCPTLLINSYFDFSLESLGLGILVALLSQIIGYVLWFNSVKILGAVRTSSLTILVPVAAHIFTFILLGEVPSMREALGASLTLIGVLLTQIPNLFKKVT